MSTPRELSMKKVFKFFYSMLATFSCFWETLSQDLLSLMQEKNVPGISWVEIEGGQIVDAGAMGVKNSITKTPIDTTTIFEPLLSVNLFLPMKCFSWLKRESSILTHLFQNIFSILAF